MKKLVVSAIALSVLAVQPVHAQEEKVSVSQRGSEAVTMGAGSNSASIGYWHKLTGKTSLGGDFTFFYRDHDHNDYQSYQFSPGIRHYLLADKAVSPYLYGAVVGRYSKSGSDQPDSRSRTESYTAGLQGGIGLEWFPIQNVSIGGHVGINANYEKAHSAYNSQYSDGLGGTTTSGATASDEGFVIGTFSSGILLNLYF